jgi:diguanylate cyclase (GGDEF)-like protein
MKQTLSGQLGFTLRAKTTEELYFLAYMDPVTTTYNRNMLREMYKELDSKMLCVVIVTVDDFNNVLDKYGGSAADYTLKRAADRLKRISEAVFKLDGSEFLLLDQSAITPESIDDIPNISYGIICKLPKMSLSQAMYDAYHKTTVNRERKRRL